jgi:hypothetical protein
MFRAFLYEDIYIETLWVCCQTLIPAAGLKDYHMIGPVTPEYPEKICGVW